MTNFISLNVINFKGGECLPFLLSIVTTTVDSSNFMLKELPNLLSVPIPKRTASLLFGQIFLKIA